MRKGKFTLPDWMKSSAMRIAIAVVLIAALIFGGVSFMKKDHEAGALEQGLGAAVTWVQSGFARAGNWIVGLFGGPYWDAEMVEEYRALKQEVAALQTENLQMEQIEAENERLTRMLGAKDAYSDYNPVFARVINHESTAYSNTIVIDAGTRDGIAVDMAVVGDMGLVGRVTYCAGSWSRVECIISNENNVPAIIEQSRDPGVVRGNMADADANGMLTILYLPDGAIVTPGDRVLTSGMGGVYPKGILIGEVSSVVRGASGYDSVLIEPAQDFVHLEEVFVITAEQTDLSDSLSEDAQ